ncbi:MAG: cytochrome ubiquinol oxidase subunit I, partial [Bacteroidales bacterium]|nr:cytochrome ubiquinol oxidase subunit I [Bacteroidales bacterium]
ETARNEMINFWAVLFNPVAVDKFMHTITSGFLLGSIFVIGVSSFYLLKKREEWLAKRSIFIAGIFGFLSSLTVVLTGDLSARTLAEVQPVKFAAFEAHYEGKRNAGLVAFGLLKDSEEKIGEKNVKDFVMKIEIPGFLSIMTGGDKNSFVPGIKDLILGNSEDVQILSVEEKMERGRYARDLLNEYKEAKKDKDVIRADEIKNIFLEKDFINDYFRFFGYAFLRSPEDAIPNVSIAFYSFHLMVILGFFFIVICALSVFLVLRDTIQKNRWFLWLALFSIPLVYIASESGWVLAEMGRQP